MNRSLADPERRAARIAAQVAAIRAGERGAIARAISAIENQVADARALLDALADDRGRAHVVGITGAPGAGKSTLINALVLECLSRGSRVAVIAIDPTSPLTGGAVLGDRVRMGESGSDPRVFIRSLASRGHVGGLTRTTADVVDLLDVAGFALVIVETVGAGQSDVEIAGLVDTTVVVCPPGLGDDVQAIKAGILEIADVLVVSKGDLPAAERDRARSARHASAAPRRRRAFGPGADHDRDAFRRRWRRSSTRSAPMQPPTVAGRRIARSASVTPTGSEPDELVARAVRLQEADAFMRLCNVRLVDGR